MLLFIFTLLHAKARGFNNFSISGCLWEDRRQCPEGGAADDTQVQEPDRRLNRLRQTGNKRHLFKPLSR